MNNKKIKNIIFDLGGVIVDLDTAKTISSFSKLSGVAERDLLMTVHNHTMFLQYEKGEIECETFRQEIRQLFEITNSDVEIDAAWNAMIGDIPKHRLEWLSSLQQKYRVFILSNTNHIHINYVHAIMNDNYGIEDFSTYAEKVYYSQQIGMRKPDTEIFKFVIDQNNLVPQHTLFLDDNLDNLNGAEGVGIQTAQVNHPENVPQILIDAGIQL